MKCSLLYGLTQPLVVILYHLNMLSLQNVSKVHFNVEDQRIVSPDTLCRSQYMLQIVKCRSPTGPTTYSACLTDFFHNWLIVAMTEKWTLIVATIRLSSMHFISTRLFLNKVHALTITVLHCIRQTITNDHHWEMHMSPLWKVSMIAMRGHNKKYKHFYYRTQMCYNQRWWY